MQRSHNATRMGVRNIEDPDCLASIDCLCRLENNSVGHTPVVSGNRYECRIPGAELEAGTIESVLFLFYSGGTLNCGVGP